MDKSLGTLLSFWGVFQFTQVQPLPSPPKQCWTRVSRVATLYRVGEGRTERKFRKGCPILRGNREITEKYEYCSTVPRTFCPGLWLLRRLMMFSLVFLLAICDPSSYGFDSQVRTNPQLIPTIFTSSTKALERWDDKHVRLLIASYMKSHITQQSIRSDFWFRGRVPFSLGYPEWSRTGRSGIMESTLNLPRRRF